MIDEIDVELIRQLQKDCRARHVDIAKKLNVVEGTVRKRIRALLENNIIKNVAAPNISKLGYNFIGFMALQVQVAKLRRIADILGKKPNVCYLAFVTGRYDMIALVITRSPQEFAQLIEKEMSVIPGVVRLETFVNLETLKGGWPIVDTTQLLNSVDVSELKEK